MNHQKSQHFKRGRRGDLIVLFLLGAIFSEIHTHNTENEQICLYIKCFCIIVFYCYIQTDIRN